MGGVDKDWVHEIHMEGITGGFAGVKSQNHKGPARLMST